MSKTNLFLFDNSWYSPGKNIFIRIIWFYVNSIFINSNLLNIYEIKVMILRLFGAKIGVNCILKPCVNIKYPWNLSIGDNVWIGESVWIDNLDKVTIGNNVTISQGALLISGSHNYKKISFDLILGEITLEDGVWIASKSVVSSGVTCKSHSILALNSVATSDLDEYGVYRGNPAQKCRQRIIEM